MLMLPAIVKGGAPETVDVILNCQLSAMFWALGVGAGIPPPAAPL
jgi:hypothetical protein